MPQQLLSKKSLESMIKRIDSTTEKRMNCELITDCYKVLDYFKTPLINEYSEASNFCSELRTHSEKKHHLPNEMVLYKWKQKLKLYLNYLKENYDTLDKI